MDANNETLRTAVEMVADGSVRYVPAQPSFGRDAATIKVSTGWKAMTAETVAMVCDALKALRAEFVVEFETERYACGTISEGCSYVARVRLAAS